MTIVANAFEMVTTTWFYENAKYLFEAGVVDIRFTKIGEINKNT